MIDLIDQSDRNRHIYRCDLCGLIFVAPTPARATSHICGKPDVMLPVVPSPLAPAAPITAKRGRKPKAAPVPMAAPDVPKNRGRKPKAVLPVA